jgi:hypothetical protein
MKHLSIISHAVVAVGALTLGLGIGVTATAAPEPAPVDFGWTTFEGGYIFASWDEADEAMGQWSDAGGGTVYATNVDDGYCVQTELQYKDNPLCGRADDWKEIRYKNS